MISYNQWISYLHGNRRDEVSRKKPFMILLKFFPCLVLGFSLSCVKASRTQTAQKKNYSRTESLADFNNRALFQAGKIQLEIKKFSHTKKSDWKGRDHIEFWFSVCDFRDRASRGTLIGQNFHIQSELGEDIVWNQDGDRAQFTNPIKVTSDNCLRWKQEVPVFNYFAKSVNLVIHYEIESLSGNTGKIIRRVMINPWDIYRDESRFGGFHDITFFNKSDWPRGEQIIGEKNIVAALHGSLFPSDSTLQMRSLQVLPVQREQQPNQPISKSLKELGVDKETEQDIRRKVDKRVLDISGINMTINVTARPFVRMQDSTGLITDKDILSGRFKVFANLVASGASGDKRKYLLSDDVHQITGQSTAFTWSMDENGLQMSIPMVLKKRNTLGRVELVMKVMPVSPGLTHLKPFTGIYDLGEWNEWVRNQRPQFKREGYEPIKNIDYDRYIANLNLDVDHLLRTIQDAKQYVFSSFTPRFIRIMPGETATDRTLHYRVETCIVNGITGNRVGEGLQFDIETNDDYLGKYKIRRETNNEGCLTWFGFLSHKYYRKEVLKKKEALVTYAGTSKCKYVKANKCKKQEPGHIKFIQEYIYYMNPWDEKWTFGWDARDMLKDYPEQIKEQRKTAPDSKIFIPGFKYETMGFRYSVDKFLNLKVKKTVLLSLHAYALKYNSIILGRGATEKLRDGVYLMKVALQKDYLDPAARGVRIYDKKLSYSNTKNFARSDTELDEAVLKALKGKTLKELRLSDVLEFGASPNQVNLVELNDTKSHPVAVIEREDGQTFPLKFYEDNDGEHYPAVRLYEDEEGNTHSVNQGDPLPNELTDDSKKQFITVQQKLVRVIGGRIITPVEFEINDLRLMRIRNQFFLQLETIDERKLRRATMVNRVINFRKQNFQEQYQKIYDMIDQLQENKENKKAVHDAIHRLFEQAVQASDEYDEDDLQKIRAEIHNMFGLKEGMENYEQRKEEVRQKLSTIFEYKSAGLDTVAAFRNDKRAIIDGIVRQYTRKSEHRIQNIMDRIGESDPEQRESFSKDPWQKFMFPRGNWKNWKDFLRDILKKRFSREQNGKKGQVLKSIANDLKNIDFTTSPLTPDFSLDLLSNKGPTPEPKYDEKDNELPDNGASGLPARTFVGPLTFLFNRNNSHLRPTDVLNEEYCRTATCNVPDMIERMIGGDPSQKRTIYLSNDSVNEGYENSEYYGFLRAYYNMTVDHLIERKKDIDKKHIRKMEMGSQLINFVRSMRLKHLSLHNDNPDLRLREINWEACKEKDVDSLEECYSSLESGPEVYDKEVFHKQLNDRYYSQQMMDAYSEIFPDESEKTTEDAINESGRDNPFCYDANSGEYENCTGEESINARYYYLGKRKLNDEDVNEIISVGPNDRGHDFKKNRDFSHRMCFVLTQTLFARNFFHKSHQNNSEGDAMTGFFPLLKDMHTLDEIEEECHRFIANVYDYPDKLHGRKRKTVLQRLRESDAWDKLKPDIIKYSPIVLERKIRVFKTTGRYTYRGGKSINVNVSAGFNVASTRSVSASTRTIFEPYSWFTDVVVWAAGGAIVGAAAGAGVGAVPGYVAGAGFGILAGITKTMLGGFNVTRSNSREEISTRRGGTTISSGVFMVAQQSILDVELGEYEKCLVARFHPMFLKHILNNKIKDPHPDFNDKTDLDSLGIMICTGKKENKCLPVKEKYFYFTQHFTDGDMLDVADLHNHPWLLQLRGIRDFKTFTSLIGAREVEADDNSWLWQLTKETYKDFVSLRFDGSQSENRAGRFKVAEQDSDFDWIINNLSETYFNILPTFPSIYTVTKEEPQFPWHNPDANHLLKPIDPALLGCHQ